MTNSPSLREAACLIFLTPALGHAVFWYGGGEPVQRQCSWLALGLLGLVLWLLVRNEGLAPGPGRLVLVGWSVLMLLAFVAFQATPLPESVLGVLSPTRGGEVLGWIWALPLPSG